MKKKLTFLKAAALIALTAFSNPMRADLGVIGTSSLNTNGSTADPINDFYNSIRYQVVYTAAELTAAGLLPGSTIDGLGWSVSEAPGTLDNYTIRVGHTTLANASAHIAAPSTTVKDPFSYTPSVVVDGSFDMISFDNTFEWDGVSNIFIDICTGPLNPFSSPYGGVRGFSLTNGARHISSDGGGLLCETSTTTTLAIKPQVQLSYVLPLLDCYPVTGIAATATSPSSASVSWTAPSTAPSDGYEYYYSTDNTAPDATTVPSGSVAAGVTSTVLSSLTEYTYYYIWVRSDCGVDGTSTWSPSATFYTGPCIPSSTSSLTYISGFSTTMGTSSNISHTSGYTTGGYQNNLATQNVTSYETGTFSFTLTLVGGSAGVAVWVDWNNDMTFSTSERVYVSSGYTSGPVNATITVPAGTALGEYTMRALVDYNTSVPNNPCGFGGARGEVEDYKITVAAPPSCITPTGLAHSAITNSGATITWTEPIVPPSDGYEYYFSTSATAPDATTTPSGTVGAGVTTVTLTTLSPITQYYVWVRSACEAGEVSSWSSATSFTTLCNTYPLPLNEGFNATTIPACWSTQLVTATANKISFVSSGSNPTTSPSEGSHFVMFNSYSSSGGGSGAQQRLITPALDATGFTDIEVSFDWRYNNTDYSSSSYLTEGVQVQYSLDDGSTWTDAGAFIPRPVVANEWRNVAVTLPGAAAGSTNLKVAFKFNSSWGNNLYLDNVSIDEAPEAPICVAAPLAPLDGNSICESSAGIVLSWDPVAEATSYTIFLSEADGTTTDSLTTIAGTSYTTPALEPGDYIWKVVPKNSGGAAVGCTDFTFTVNPLPVVTISSPVTSYCETNTTPVTLTASGAVSYVWTPADGLSATTGSSVDALPTSTTTYTVIGTDANGCESAPATFTIEVKPELDPLSIAADTALCAGDIVEMTATGGSFYSSGEGTIGTGTSLTGSTSQPTAFCNRFAQYWMQSIYTASELTALGLQAGDALQSIAFTITSLGSASNVQDFRVYLGHTTETTITTMTTAGLDLVAGGIGYTYNHTVGDNIIAFDVPFVWDGTSNIKLDLRQSGLDDLYNAETYYTTASSNITAYKITSTERTVSDLTTMSTSLTNSSSRLNAKFTWGVDIIPGVVWTPAADLFMDAAATIPYVAGDTATTVYAKPLTNVEYVGLAQVPDGCGSADTVSLSVYLPATITDEPVSQSVCINQPLTLTFSADNALSFVWIKDGTTVLSETSTTMEILAATTADAGTYQVVAVGAGDCNDSSSVITINVDELLAITATPSDNADCATPNGSIDLAGLWTDGASYEVFANGTSMGTFVASAGVLNVLGLNAGTYEDIYAVGTDICGTDTIATLTVGGVDADAAGVTPATNSNTSTQLAGETVTYVDADCKVIATINATGGDLGAVTTKAVVEATTGEYNGEFYVQRHFEITAANASVPAEVTLYVLESEIIDFNDNNGTMLDIDLMTGANLTITAFHSPEASGGTGPDGHDADATELIAPTSFVYNATADRYEITFTTSGFSGFYISTTPDEPMNIALGEVAAKADGQRNLIEWNSLDESSADYFEVQRSTDARSFETIATVEANGKPSKYNQADYSFDQVLTHYRIVMYSQSGKKVVSKTVSVSNSNVSQFALEAFPNPFSDRLTVRIKGEIAQDAQVTVTDIHGRIVYSQAQIKTQELVIPMNSLPAGNYIVRYQDAANSQSIKVTKK